DLKTTGQEKVSDVERQRVIGGMRVGIEFYLLLVPTVFSPLPAVSRACIRLKLLLPESLVPGWGLAASTPLFVLLTFSTFAIQYPGASRLLPVFFAGLLLWVSLSVRREERAFPSSPLSSGFDRRITGLGAALQPRGTGSSAEPPVA